MGKFSDFAYANERVCQLCRFIEVSPHVWAEILDEFNNGRLKGKRASKYAKLIADFITTQAGFPIKAQCVRDHFRSDH